MTVNLGAARRVFLSDLNKIPSPSSKAATSPKSIKGSEKSSKKPYVPKNLNIELAPVLL